MKKDNKKNNILIALIAFLAVVLVLIIMYLFLYHKSDDDTKIRTDAIYMGLYGYDNRLIEKDNYVITNYNDYLELFNTNEIKESDFKNNNYVLLEIVYDECSEKNVDITKYTIEDNLLTVYISYYASCGVCAPNYIYYLIPVDKSVTNVTIKQEFSSVNDPQCRGDIAYKPMIYLYPEEETEVIVKLLNSKYLTTTYPKYNSSWKVLAKPNGDLYDENGKYYYGLYWEGNNHKAKVQKDGFVVRGEDTAKFLEEKLELLGLNEREANEFIIYWLPKLENNKYNYIRFESIEEINNYMPLEVSPEPDTIIRVLMDYKDLDEKIEVVEQELVPIKRNGFTVVEWGGSIIE